MSPLAKTALWFASVLAVALAIEGGAAALGLGFSVFDSNHSGVLIAVALAALLALMAWDQRPMSDYGLVADRHWLRRALAGLACGAGAFSAYWLLAWSRGVFLWTPQFVTPGTCVAALLGALTVPAVAATQQVLFSGYLLAVLRERHGPALSAALPASAFAAAAALTRPGGLAGVEGQRVFFGVWLLGTLLGLLRLRTGSIAFPAGLLAGALVVRKLATKARVVWYDPQAADLWWLAPDNDYRQAPAFWALLAAATLAVWWSLARNGPRRLAADPAAEAAFKRFLPFSNLMAFAPIDAWAWELWRARFRVPPLYWPRLMVTLLTSILTTLATLPERLLAPLLLRRPAPDPVCIVGMYRSGTTHLHNLLALDPAFCSPRNYQVFNPHGFLTGWLTTACMAPLMTWRRPMDAVQMSVFSAQEEEFALAALGAPSPVWGFCFPRELGRHERYFEARGFSPRDERRWARRYRLFLRKLAAFSPKTPLLKNPANTGRVAMVRRCFPGARFVHLVRDPHDVHRSNQRLAEQGLVVFQLQDPLPGAGFGDHALGYYRRMTDAFYRDAAGLPPGDVVEVRFERLEADPLGTVEHVYRGLGLPLSPAFRSRLEAYLHRIQGYQKNPAVAPSREAVAAVDRAMGPHLARWGYSATSREAA